MRLEAPRNEAVLNALGVAQFGSMTVSLEFDKKGKVVAYIVPDNLDLSTYEAEVAKLAGATVPASISRRQFAHALANDGSITQDEALAFVRTGALPEALQAAVNGIKKADQKFAAEMMLSGATTFERDHPMVAVLAKALSKSDADLDALWTAAAAL